METAPHHRSDKLCYGGNTHQDDRHKGQDYVYTFPKQHFGIYSF